jgi:hypothetical protein
LGDLGAQWLEHRNIQKEEDILEAIHDESTSLEKSSAGVRLRSRPTVQYRSYGELSPPVATLQHKLHEQHRKHTQRLKEPETTKSELITDWMSEQILELKSFDLFRTSTMVFWSSIVYTPFFVALFGLYAKYWPVSQKYFWSQAAARALVTFSCAVPLTTAFFAYGCTVHHVTQWFTVTSSTDDLSNNKQVVQTSLLSAIQLKLERELEPTLKTAAMIWLPVNFANFAFVPAHWRPVCLVSVSVFWNGYLSLAQHRNIDL